MAPNLTNSERIEYLHEENETITDMLDGAEDCKWIYQSLITCSILISRIEGQLTDEARNNISQWLSELKRLDPLRRGRWQDLEKSLDI